MTLRLLGFALVVVALAVFPLTAGNYPVKLLQEILIWGTTASTSLPVASPPASSATAPRPMTTPCSH